MVTCSFCGFAFPDCEGMSACGGCPMSKCCRKHKCPRCGFEIPREPGLIKFFRKWGKKHA